jgi:hypothetical protein
MEKACPGGSVRIVKLNIDLVAVKYETGCIDLFVSDCSLNMQYSQTYGRTKIKEIKILYSAAHATVRPLSGVFKPVFLFR